MRVNKIAHKQLGSSKSSSHKAAHRERLFPGPSHPIDPGSTRFPLPRSPGKFRCGRRDETLDRQRCFGAETVFPGRTCSHQSSCGLTRADSLHGNANCGAYLAGAAGVEVRPCKGSAWTRRVSGSRGREGGICEAAVCTDRC